MQAKVSRQISCEESWLRLLAWELTPIMQHLHHSKLHPSKSLATKVLTLVHLCESTMQHLHHSKLHPSESLTTRVLMMVHLCGVAIMHFGWQSAGKQA